MFFLLYSSLSGHVHTKRKMSVCMSKSVERSLTRRATTLTLTLAAKNEHEQFSRQVN